MRRAVIVALALFALGFTAPGWALSPSTDVNISTQEESQCAEPKHVFAPKVGRFVAHGLASDSECAEILEMGKRTMQYMNVTKYTPDFGLESFQNPREKYLFAPSEYSCECVVCCFQ
jgi:hypothetical protein